MSQYLESAIDFLYNNKTTLEEERKRFRKNKLTEEQIAGIDKVDNFLRENKIVAFYWKEQDLENGLIVNKDRFKEAADLIFDYFNCGLGSFTVDDNDEPLRVIVEIYDEEIRYVLNNIHRSNFTMFGKGCGFMVVDMD